VIAAGDSIREGADMIYGAHLELEHFVFTERTANHGKIRKECPHRFGANP
jgi:hypothetical protein